MLLSTELRTGGSVEGNGHLTPNTMEVPEEKDLLFTEAEREFASELIDEFFVSLVDAELPTAEDEEVADLARAFINKVLQSKK